MVSNSSHNKLKIRSHAYPLYPLSETIQFAQKIYQNLGSGPFSRSLLAQGLGYSSFSGAVSAKIGALVHFEILARSNAQYHFTPLAREILAYPAETSLPAILEAAISPNIYKKLFPRLIGATLPHNLSLILINEFGITAKAAPRAAANFIATMEFAGLIKDNMLIPPANYPKFNDFPLASTPSNISTDKIDITSKKNSTSDQNLKIKLPSGVIIIFPPELVYRLSLGEFAAEIKSLNQKSSAAQIPSLENTNFHLPPAESPSSPK